jgi:alginate O-acetyltransferase complex protein AlgI
MNFASKTFFIFLPLVLLVYHSLPSRRHKYRFLLLASWFFYMSWNPWFLWVILFPSLVDFYAGLWIESALSRGQPRAARAWLLASLLANLGLLAFFKYTLFFLYNSCALARLLGWEPPSITLKIILPLGISFHTFQGISYTLDIYRKKLAAVRSFVDFALFVAFFPQLVAGPIVRAVEFLPQMETPPRVTARQVTEGLHWFLIGLFKKLVIADRLAEFADAIFAHPELFDAGTLLWAVLAYAAQVYCDFSGYSDMAIGCAKWFGFELPRNFNFPYLAKSIADFWRRWHMSLSTWLRDYVYISMGGNRGGTARTYFNLLVTFTLCGLWHGAAWHFVLWGFVNGLFLALHRLYDRALAGVAWADRLRERPLYQAAAWLVTMWQIFAGYVVFRSQSWSGCWELQSAMLGLTSGGVQHWLPVWVPLLVGLVALGHLFSGLWQRECGILELPSLVRAWTYAAIVVAVIVLAPGVGKAFIYFQF